MGYPKRAASYNQMIPPLVDKLARWASLRTEDEYRLPCHTNEAAKKMRFQFYGYLSVLDKGSSDDKKRADLTRELMIKVDGSDLVFVQKNTRNIAVAFITAMDELDMIIQRKSEELGIVPVGEERVAKPFIKELRTTKPPAEEFYAQLLTSTSDEVYNKLFMIVGTLPDPYAGYISRADFEKVFFAEIGLTPSEWFNLERGEEFLSNLWAQLEVWK